MFISGEGKACKPLIWPRTLQGLVFSVYTTIQVEVGEFGTIHNKNHVCGVYCIYIYTYTNIYITLMYIYIYYKYEDQIYIYIYVTSYGIYLQVEES